MKSLLIILTVLSSLQISAKELKNYSFEYTSPSTGVSVLLRAESEEMNQSLDKCIITQYKHIINYVISTYTEDSPLKPRQFTVELVTGNAHDKAKITKQKNDYTILLPVYKGDCADKLLQAELAEVIFTKHEIMQELTQILRDLNQKSKDQEKPTAMNESQRRAVMGDRGFSGNSTIPRKTEQKG